MRSRLLALAALAVVSCGGKVVVDETTSPAGTGGAGGGLVAECGKNGMPVPAVYKACAGDGDCTIKFAFLDCCGTQAAIGIAVSETAAFNAYKMKCDTIVPVCDCVPGPAVTDDGQMTAMDAASIHVSCDAGACSTFVP